MRIFLVDDEPFSIRRLTFVLKEIPDVEIVGTASNGHTAVSEIRRLKPDLAILDIEMPGCNGIAVAEALGDTGPDIVFLTAFDQYATDAFLIETADYRLKPRTPARLGLGIDRARRVAPMGRRGVVVAASAGPTIASQSLISCTPAGERLRNAARVSAGTRAPTGRGP